MTENLRFFTVAALLASTGLFLNAHERREILPARENFASFPYRLGSWTGSDTVIDKDVREVLGQGDFLARDFRNADVDNAPVNLFVAYFPSQRARDTLHSPKNCLPGAGWLPLESSRIAIALPSRSSFPVNRYLIAKGSERALALYWYSAHGRDVASEYWAKFYLVEDSIRMNRSDGSLIRVTTEVRQHETAAQAEGRLLSLLNAALPVLDAHVPR